jgi:PAS domain S-box-containing protein
MTSQNLRVLHLEPDEGHHQKIREAAVSTGLSLTFQRASNRQEFEAALRRGEIDLVLANHSVSGYDGFSALESARLRVPLAPYIVVCGDIGEDRAVECIRRGASDFVHKDRLERLPAAILRAIQGSGRVSLPGELDGQFRELAENIRDVFWVCSSDTGKVLYLSPAFDGIWGRPSDSVVSAGLRWPDSVVAEDRGNLEAAQAKLAEGLPYQVDYRIVRPDDTVRWIRDRGFPIRARAGEPGRIAGVAAEITEAKRLETELLHAQKLELVGKMAGGIAHDFNNLLTIISGYVSMLIDREQLPQASLEALKRVFTASGQASELVKQLLIFSRKRAPRREVIDLNVEVESISTMVRRLLGETIVVEFEPAPESLRSSVDIGMLEHAIVSLAVNARDAMPKGGRLVITVGIRPQDGPAPEFPVPPGDYATISVRDTGCGIPQNILSRVFEPFFTTRKDGRGAGLGLATTKDIMRQHDGWIEVKSEVNVGTIFTLYLPISRAEAASGADGRHGPSSKTSKRTILLVEDEPNVREFAVAVLQQDGFAVLQAKSGESALETWKWHSARIDLLLTDVVLPGELSGVDLGRRLQQDKPGLKVVLTTGYSREVVVPQVDGETPPLVLPKPYTPRTLSKAVRDVLE